MAVKVADIRAELSLEIASFKKDLKNAQRQTHQATKGMAKDIGGIKKSFSGAISAVKGLAGAALAAAGVAGFGSLITASINAADEIGKVASKIGLTTNELQEFRYTASAAGVKQKTLDMGMQRFSRRVAEAQKNTGELNATLKRYGIQVKDSEGKSRRVVDVFDDLADVIKGTGSEQEKLRIAFKAFDSEGAAMVNMFKNGAAGLEEYRAKAHELGLIMDEDLIRQAEKAADNMDTLGRMIKTNLMSSVLGIIPELNRLAKEFLGNKEAVADLQESVTLAGNTLKGFALIGGIIKNTFDAVGQTMAASAAQLVELGRGNLAGVKAIGQAWKQDQKNNIDDVAGIYKRLFEGITEGQTQIADQAKADTGPSAATVDLTQQLTTIQNIMAEEKKLSATRTAANKTLYDAMGLESEAYFQDQADALINQAVKWKQAGVNVGSVNEHLSTKMQELAEEASAAGVWSLETLVNASRSSTTSMLDYFADLKTTAIDDLQAIGVAAASLDQDIQIRVSVFDQASGQIDGIMAKLAQFRAATMTAPSAPAAMAPAGETNGPARAVSPAGTTININERLNRGDLSAITQGQNIEAYRG